MDTRAPARRTRRSRADEAYETLKERIDKGVYPPGFTALEEELAADLQMSRTPVREALIRLQEEGLVEVRPRRGMQVRALSTADMREIYETLAGLEAMAVDLLARKGHGPETLSRLFEPVERMERALKADDLSAWAEADEDFHEALFSLCGNARLSALGQSLLGRTRRVRYHTLHIRRRPFRSTSDHRALAELIARGAFREARESCLDHRLEAMDELLRLLDTLQNLPVAEARAAPRRPG